MTADQPRPDPRQALADAIAAELATADRAYARKAAAADRLDGVLASQNPR